MNSISSLRAGPTPVRIADSGASEGSRVVAATLGQAGRSAVGFFTGGLAGGGLGGALSSLGGGTDGLDLNRLEELLNTQMTVQFQSQVYGSRSNIAKSGHDAAMEAVRNMKA